MKKIKKIIYKAIFNYGFKVFKKTNQTPEKSYRALVNLYCLTSGKFNETLHQKVKIPMKKINNSLNGLLGHFTKKDFEKINNILNEEGYYKFENQVSDGILDKLQRFAMNTPTSIRNIKEPILFDPENIISEIYRFDVQDLVNNPDIQELIMDPVLINIAREYLDCEPIFDFPAMWWSAGFKEEASSDAAQLYHFDMDRIKWLKVFIYLNEVNHENGPHCFISGSHKIGNKPDSILARGYVRVTDEELRKFYPEVNFKELPGKAGSVFVGDTMCWHKGKPLRIGKNRLMLEFEYSSCSFGANLEKMIVNNPTSKFKEFCRQNPVFASRIQAL
jgi:hypothetical protein